jgi:hypothetical protein
METATQCNVSSSVDYLPEGPALIGTSVVSSVPAHVGGRPEVQETIWLSGLPSKGKVNCTFNIFFLSVLGIELMPQVW